MVAFPVAAQWTASWSVPVAEAIYEAVTVISVSVTAVTVWGRFPRYTAVSPTTVPKPVPAMVSTSAAHVAVVTLQVAVSFHKKLQPPPISQVDSSVILMMAATS